MGRADVRDIAVNVLVYLPLGLFAYTTLTQFRRMKVAVLLSLLLGFVLSTLVEVSQVFIVGRVPSLLDVITDTVGTSIGIFAGVLWSRRRHPTARRPDSDLLLCFWVLYQCFPFVPQLKASVIVRSHAEDVLLFFAAAAALVPMVRSLGGTERWSRIVLGALLLLVPLKAFLFTRGVALAEIICSAVIFAIAWFVPLRATPLRAAIVAPVLAVAVAVHGLAPFHFLAVPHAFSWVPFQASFYSEWEPALTIMLGKVFLYGALLWLIHESGVRLAAATVLTAAMLAAIEAIQMYLPGRSSEIVDPLIAVVLGWVFWSLGEDALSSGARRCAQPS